MNDRGCKLSGGFTLLEILVVVTIVGVLAAAAVPSYINHVERVRSAEGVQILTALLAAQERRRLDNGAYAADTVAGDGTGLALLDITIPTGGNFVTPANPNPNIYNGAARLASVNRSDGTYTLCINSTGVVSCAGVAANVCATYAPGGVGICP